MLVAFEGIDGSGKSTLARAVARRLRAAGRRVHATQEPTKTALGKAVRAAIRRREEPLALCGLFLADRAAHVKQLEPRLARGELVLTDRYMDSTTAYQSHALAALHPRALVELDSLQSTLFPRPDLVFLCDLEPKAALARIQGRAVKEPFEKLKFLQGVRKNYLALARRHSQSFVVLDATRPIEPLVEEVLRVLAPMRP